MPWLTILGVLAVVAGICGFGYSAGQASTQRAWDKDKAVRMQSAFDMSERARATEAALRDKKEEAERHGQAEKVRSNHAAAVLRADADRVRSDFNAYLSGPANDTTAACVGRGKATGALLEEAMRVTGEMASDGESCEANVRTLLGAWPVAD
jgi:hypothetical protein